MLINSQKLAFFLIEKYKSKWDYGNPYIKSEICSEEHELEYAMNQIKQKTIRGIGIDVMEKDILEIGCGHGGISIYLSMNGARTVKAIDISNEALVTAEKIKKNIEEKGCLRGEVIEFYNAGAEKLPFPDDSFDIILTDNVLEHLTNLENCIKEFSRVLRKGGVIYAPCFSSIYSRYGSHLKYGTKIPWLHIFFTEKAICRALYKRALEHPELKLFEWYGGLKLKPLKFQDIRKYKDLNYITHKKVRVIIKNCGLKLEEFYVNRSIIQKVIIKSLPFLRYTIFDDIFSSGARLKAIKY